MQVSSAGSEQSSFFLGRRRGIPELARFSLDLDWAREETECAGRLEPYPSPPMSGSSPSPTNPNPETGDQGQRRFRRPSYDVPPRSAPPASADYRAHSLAPAVPLSRVANPRIYPAEPLDRPHYHQYGPGPEPPSRPMSFPVQHGTPMPPAQYPMPPITGPGPLPSPYSMTSSSSQGPEPPGYSSPKTQRKTKGHVASACVPCKRAHLRCNAQRPCSRCVSTGKEDACVDVQHKKRGRPRLRDDRDGRFDNARHTPHPSDPSATRPVVFYSAAREATSMSQETPAQRSQQTYRNLESQPSNPMSPRYPQHFAPGPTARTPEASHFPPPSPLHTTPMEPVAFLTTNLEVVKASSAFCDGVGARRIDRRNMLDLVSRNERDRMAMLQRTLQDEQAQKEPNYLPPIYGREEAERVIQGLPFTPDSVSRYVLARQDTFTFVSGDGERRPHSVRVGLAKEDSIYFVVVLLSSLQRPRSHTAPTPAPHFARGGVGEPSNYSTLNTPIYSLTSGPPVAAVTATPTFDHAAATRFRDPLGDSYAGGAGAPPPQPPSRPSPRQSHSYTISSAGTSLQVPRSQLPLAAPPRQELHHHQPARYSLPPIQSRPLPRATTTRPDSRSGGGRRSDIRGLLDQPDPPR